MIEMEIVFIGETCVMERNLLIVSRDIVVIRVKVASVRIFGRHSSYSDCTVDFGKLEIKENGVAEE